MEKKKIMISIDKKIADRFDEFCKKNALIKSKVVENLIKEYLDKQQKKEGKLFL